MVVKVTGAAETPDAALSVTVAVNVTVVPALTGEDGVAFSVIAVGTPAA